MTRFFAIYPDVRKIANESASKVANESAKCACVRVGTLGIRAAGEACMRFGGRGWRTDKTVLMLSLGIALLVVPGAAFAAGPGSVRGRPMAMRGSQSMRMPMPSRMPGTAVMTPGFVYTPASTIPRSSTTMPMGIGMGSSNFSPGSSMFNGMGQTSPFTSRMAWMSLFRNSTFGMNPYMSSGGYGGRGASGGGGGYGGGGGGYGSGGSGSGSGSSSANSRNASDPYTTYAASQEQGYGSQTANGSAQYGAAELGMVLTAAGVPNKKGNIDWPLALRILRPDEETRELRKQVETLVQVLAGQQATLYPNPRYIHQTRQAVGKLRSFMDRERYALSAGSYREADRFLGKLETFLQGLERG